MGIGFTFGQDGDCGNNTQPVGGPFLLEKMQLILYHPQTHLDIRTWVMGKLGGWHGLHITQMSDLTNVISDGIGYI